MDPSSVEEMERFENTLVAKALSEHCELHAVAILNLMLLANVDELVDEDKCSAERLTMIDDGKLRLWRLAVAYRAGRDGA